MVDARTAVTDKAEEMVVERIAVLVLAERDNDTAVMVLCAVR